MIRKITCVAVLVAMLLTTSCVKLNLNDVTDAGIETQFVLPIGSVTAHVMDVLTVLGDDFVEVDSASEIFLVWPDTVNLFDFKLANISTGEQDLYNLKFVDILDPTLAALINASSSSVAIPAGNYDFDGYYDYNFAYNTTNTTFDVVAIDSIRVNDAVLSLTFNAQDFQLDANNYIELSINFPEIQFAQPTVIYQKLTQSSVTQTIPLPSFTVAFHDDLNSTPIEINILIKSNGNLRVSKTSELKVTSQIHSINALLGFGYVWHNTPLYSANKTITMDIEQYLGSFGENNLKFANPQLYAKVISTIGVPFNFVVNDVVAYKNGQAVEKADFNGSPTFTQYVNPALAPGDSAITELVLDKNNGGVDRLLNAMPDHMTYSYSLSLCDNSGVHNQFITYPTKAKVEVKARIQLAFKPGSDFTYNDTIPADISSMLGDVSEFTRYVDPKKLVLFLDVDNLIPLKLEAELVALDANDNEILTIKNIDIASAKVDEQGYAIESNKSSLTIEIGGEEIENFVETKNFVVRLKIATADDNSYSDVKTTDSIKIKIGAYIKAAVSANLDDLMNQN